MPKYTIQTTDVVAEINESTVERACARFLLALEDTPDEINVVAVRFTAIELARQWLISRMKWRFATTAGYYIECYAPSHDAATAICDGVLRSIGEKRI